MKIIVCVDDGMGMLFNHRRQSRDRILIEDVLKLTEGHTLYINSFLEKLFDKATVNENILDVAGDDNYCFVENIG